MARKPRSRSRTPWWEDALVALFHAVGATLRAEGRGLKRGLGMTWTSARRRAPQAANATYTGLRWGARKTGWARKSWNGETLRDQLRELREELRQFGPGKTTIVDFFSGNRYQMRDADTILGEYAIDDGHKVEWLHRPHTDAHPYLDHPGDGIGDDYTAAVKRWEMEFGAPSEWQRPKGWPEPRRMSPWSRSDRQTVGDFLDDLEEDFRQRQPRPRTSAPDPPAWEGEGWESWDPPYRPRTPIDGSNVVPFRPRGHNPGGSNMATALDNLVEAPEWNLDNYQEEVPKWIEDIGAALDEVAERLNQAAETASQRKLPQVAQSGLSQVAEALGEARQRLSGVSSDVSSQFSDYETPSGG